MKAAVGGPEGGSSGWKGDLEVFPFLLLLAFCPDTLPSEDTPLNPVYHASLDTLKSECLDDWERPGRLEWVVMPSYTQASKILSLQQAFQSPDLHEGSSVPYVKYVGCA